MSVSGTLINNTMWRSAADLVSRLTSALFWILVARYLGANALGSIAFAVSLFSFFELVSSLGLGSVLTRDVAKNNHAAAGYYGHALAIGSVSAIIFTAVMLLTVMLVKPNPDTAVNACIMAMAMPLAGIIYFSRAMLIAVEKMMYATYASFCENAFQLAIGWLMLLRGSGATDLVWLLVISKAVACVLIVFFVVTRVTAPRWHITRKSVAYWFAQIPSFLLIAVLNGMFWSVTVILLTKFSGEVEAGYFSAAYKLVSFFLLFAWAYGQALFPVAAKMTDTSFMSTGFVQILRRSLKYIFMGTLAIAAGLSLLSRQIVIVLYGVEMLQTAEVLRWLAWVLVPYAAIPILAYTLISHRLQRRDLAANFLGTLTLILANVLLVPRWGAVGAAMAMLAGSIVFFAVEYISVHRLLFSLRISHRHFSPLTGVALMSLWLFYTREQHIVIAVVFGAVIYIAVLLLTRSIDKREMASLRNYLMRWRYKDRPA